MSTPQRRTSRSPSPGGGTGTGAQALIGWSFALPFVLLFGVFMAGPIVISFATSFTDMRVTDIRNPFDVGFVGFDNYVDVFQDPTFRKAARNTAVYVLFAMPLTIGLGLLIALGLNQGVRAAAQRLAHRLLPAVRHEHGRDRRRVAADPRHRRRPAQRAAREDRHRRPGLADRPEVGPVVDDPDDDVARPRPADDRLPRRAAGDPQRAVRGGVGRRGDAAGTSSATSRCRCCARRCCSRR